MVEEETTAIINEIKGRIHWQDRKIHETIYTENLESNTMDVNYDGNPLLHCEVCDGGYFLSDHYSQPLSYPLSYSPPLEKQTPSIPTTIREKKRKTTPTNGEITTSSFGAGHQGSIGEEGVPKLFGILLQPSSADKEVDPDAETQRLFP
jgi:hypothetical protein